MFVGTAPRSSLSRGEAITTARSDLHSNLSPSSQRLMTA